MKTIGTGNLTALTTADLRTYIGALALDVYEAALLGMPDFDVAFALGTLDRFRVELERRIGAERRFENDLAADAEAARELARLNDSRAAFPPQSMLDAARRHHERTS